MSSGAGTFTRGGGAIVGDAGPGGQPGAGIKIIRPGFSRAAADGRYVRKNALQVAATDFIRLGAAPPSVAALNIDGATFPVGIAFSTIARVRMGAGGFALQDSTGVADRFIVADSGDSAVLSGINDLQFQSSGSNTGFGARIWRIQNTNASGRAVALRASNISGAQAGIVYASGTTDRAALRVDRVASGFGTLDAMEAGGVFRLGSAGNNVRLEQNRETITYSASMTPSGAVNAYVITITDGVAHAINAPTANPSQTGAVVTFTLRNTSGGVAGVATWNAIYKMAAWVQPLTANSRSITFIWDGTNYIEISRTAADIPN